jgi:K+-transporting ATPase A subunit
MLIAFILAVIIIGLYVWGKKSPYCVDAQEILLFMTLAVLLLHMIFWPFFYLVSKNNVVVYQATKDTIENSRNSTLSEFERAALINKIIETNQYLASVKYWNKTILGCYICDESTRLEPLK